MINEKIEEKIEKLREKLNKSIENQEDYDVIYKLSTDLDELIVQYYKQKIEINLAQRENIC